MKRVVLSSILILAFILAGTTIAILYAKGYRFGPQNGKTFIEGTGLLVVTSKPEGARVLINDHLTTATNNTINLSPGKYDIRIEKDGYIPWKKKISVQKEVVTEATALLLPSAPKLEAVTTTGAKNPVMNQLGTFLAYTVSSASASKNGVYILDMNARLFLGSPATQLTDNSVDRFSESTLSFSPDGKSLLAQVKNPNSTNYYLIPTNGFTSTPQDITATFTQVKNEWDLLTTERNKKILESLPRGVRPLAQMYFKDISLSVDGTRIVYSASQSGTLDIVKKPPIIGGNSTPETRNLKKDNIYVYDLKDDRNFLIFDSSSVNIPKFLWHPDSDHLVFVQDTKISIIEYDGTNSTTVYAGPFLDSYVFPWTDGESLVFITTLNNPSVPYNLYRLGLQ